MKTLLKFINIFLLISISFCIYVPNEDFQEIKTLVKTEFNINKNKEAYFKYKLGDTHKSIGLQFLVANLYTVEVLIYKSEDLQEPFISYNMAKEPFKEVDVTDFGEYAYIVIKETFEYYYQDYITIYNPSEVIELKSGEPLVINKFLSNGRYEMTFSPKVKSALLYNTNNIISSNREITITTDTDTKIIDSSKEGQIKIDLDPGKYSILVQNNFDPEKEEEGNLEQGFSLIVYEKEDLFRFNELTKNVISNTNYIYSNEPQYFYYYADISENKNSNTINFKLNYKYYKLENSIKFYTNIIYLNEKITKSDLENNIPTENKNPASYEDDSDEFFRIYFHDERADSKFKYLLVKVEITESKYYMGSNYFEVSLGEEVIIKDFTNIENNEAQTIQVKKVEYIPTYFKLILNSKDKYLLTSQNQDLTTFIKGDLITADNKINKDYLESTNEIIVISGIPELTIKLFGSSDSEVKFFLEKIDSSQLQYNENRRNNDIYEATMNENEIKYILGTFDYEEYAYGVDKIIYYATVNSGEFEIYYKNYTSLEGKSLFPTQESQLKQINKEIPFETNVDLITIKCKKSGSMSIRPVAKDFVETTHLLKQNSVNQITLYNSNEILQLTTNLGQNTGIVYFSILSLDGEEIKISPDTPGLFKEETIKNNELFAKSIDLSKYKMDQLAIKISCSSAEKNIEIFEIIHNDFNTYQKLENGENKEIKLHNVYFPLDKEVQKLNLVLGNLQNKKISYGVIKSANKDSNYLLTADKYANTTTEDLKENSHTLEITNVYYNLTDNMKPYTFALVSVLGEDKDLLYNVNIGKDAKEEVEEDNTLLILFLCIISVIVITFIILAVIIILKKQKNNENSNNFKSINDN